MFSGSNARDLSAMYNGAFRAPSIHKGKPVYNKSVPFLYSGPGIDKIERVYQNVGEVIRAWMNEDPANHTIAALVFTANEYAKQRNISARLKYQMVYQYLNGRFAPVYKTEKVTKQVAAAMVRNKNLKFGRFKIKFVKEVTEEGESSEEYAIVPVFDRDGNIVISAYNWFCCQPKDINVQLIAAALGMRHNEVTGYDPNTRFRAVATTPPMRMVSKRAMIAHA